MTSQFMRQAGILAYNRYFLVNILYQLGHVSCLFQQHEAQNLFNFSSQLLFLDLQLILSLFCHKFYTFFYVFASKRPQPFCIHYCNQDKLVSQLEFNAPFQHKYGYIRDETRTSKTNTDTVYSMQDAHLRPRCNICKINTIVNKTTKEKYRQFHKLSYSTNLCI